MPVGSPLNGANASLDFPITTTGTYTVVATDAATGCTAVSNAQALTVNATPAAPAVSSPQTFCFATNLTVASLSATGTAVKWYAAASGGESLATTTTLTNNTIYYASQTINGCESARAAVTVTIYTTPAAPTASSPQTFCSANNPTVASLSATGTAVKWYAAASGWASLNTTTTLTSGTYYASQTTNGCESARAAVTVTIYTTPAAPTGASNNSRCGSGTVTFSAIPPTGCTIDWYDAASGGSTVTDGYGVSSFASSITGATTYYAQARDNTTGCVSATRLPVTGTMHTLPAAPTGASSNTRCGSGTITFNATVPNGCTIDWYNAASGGSTVTGGYGVSSFASSITATTTYYAQARDNTTGCVSATRLPVTATVHPAVGAASISGAASNTCLDTTVALTATASGATTFTWYKDGSQVQTGTSSAYTATASGSYTVQGKNANCTGTTSANKVITITVCGNVPGCDGLRLYQTTSPTDGNGTWGEANAYCTNKDARLPTLTELECMCTNRENLPGGYSVGDYWSSTQVSTNTSLYEIVNFTSSGCHRNYWYSGYTAHFRCVQ
jgi:hypothetical protein